MAKLTKRLGNAFWNVQYKGKTFKRKVNRKVTNGNIDRYVIINGKKVRVE